MNLYWKMIQNLIKDHIFAHMWNPGACRQMPFAQLCFTAPCYYFHMLIAFSSSRTSVYRLQFALKHRAPKLNWKPGKTGKWTQPRETEGQEERSLDD